MSNEAKLARMAARDKATLDAMLLPYDSDKTHPIRMPTEADGFTKAQIEEIRKGREAKRAQGKSLVGDY